MKINPCPHPAVAGGQTMNETPGERLTRMAEELQREYRNSNWDDPDVTAALINQLARAFLASYGVEVPG